MTLTVIRGTSVDVPPALLDGSLPTVYDPAWRSYSVALTPAQTLAFQAFPQDLLFYLHVRYNAALESGTTVNAIPLRTAPSDLNRISQMIQAFDKGIINNTAFEDGNGNWHQVNANQAGAIYSSIVQFNNQIRATALTLANGINGKSVTTRMAIDQAIAAVAPNSISATNPSPN